jgi:hypothetical protein
VLAPTYKVNDFSTESLLRNTGNNLTGEVLSQLTITKMIERVLQKAGVIGVDRLLRVLNDAS